MFYLSWPKLHIHTIFKCWNFYENVFTHKKTCCFTPEAHLFRCVWPTCATERHSSSVLGPHAIFWEPRKIYEPVHEIVSECDLLIGGFKWGWIKVKPEECWCMSVRKTAPREVRWQWRYGEAALSAGHFSCRARLRRVPPGCLRPSHFSCVRTVQEKQSRKCRNIIFCSFVLWPDARSLVGNRVSDRKLGASACYLAVRRHRETEEGRQRVVHTDESNYWHLLPTSLLCAWTKLKGHRCEGFSFISVYQFSQWVFFLHFTVFIAEATKLERTPSFYLFIYLNQSALLL